MRGRWRATDRHGPGRQDRRRSDGHRFAPRDDVPPGRTGVAEVPVTVSWVVDVDGKNPQHAVVLFGGELSYRRVAVSGSGPIIGHVDAGDPAVVRLWRDRVIAVHAGGRTEETHDTPYDDASRAILTVAAVTPPALVFLRIAWWLHRRRADVAEESLDPLVHSWGPPDVGFVAVTVTSLVGYVVMLRLGFRPGLPTRAAITAATALASFVAGTWVTARLKQAPPPREGAWGPPVLGNIIALGGYPAACRRAMPRSTTDQAHQRRWPPTESCSATPTGISPSSSGSARVPPIWRTADRGADPGRARPCRFGSGRWSGCR